MYPTRPVKNCAYERGFSLLELMVAFTIAALLVGFSTPVAMRMYDSMQYRSAVGDINTALAKARYYAITRGHPVDVELIPDERKFRVGEQAFSQVSKTVNLVAEVAAELSPDSHVAVVRFYPDGSSSGGNVSVVRASGAGVRLDVDWLLGRVSQTRLGQE